MASEEQRAGWPQSVPEFMGFETLERGHGRAHCRMDIRPEHQAPNGYMQATMIIGLADITCASGTFESLPEGASFATVELKSNLVGTARDGGLSCVATMRHGGRTTQVWDAEVTHEQTGKTVALFRCTQLVIYPRNS